MDNDERLRNAISVCKQSIEFLESEI